METIEFLTDEEKSAIRHHRCYKEGEAANDHNHRVYRKQQGVVQGNPYEVGSEEWKSWRDGYAYRDMVNDG